MRCGDYRPRSGFVAAILLVASLSIGGCGLLSAPGTLSSDAPLTMEVSSTATAERGVLPAAYTCYGEHKHRPESPPVAWSGANPRTTKSFVVIIDDADAPITPRVYWLVFGIGADTADIQAGQLPPGARVARNSAGNPGYDPPCPVGAPHRYRISVYALNTVIVKALPQIPQLLPAWSTIAPHVIARGTMTVTACPAPTTHTANPACQKGTTR